MKPEANLKMDKNKSRVGPTSNLHFGMYTIGAWERNAECCRVNHYNKEAH